MSKAGWLEMWLKYVTSDFNQRVGFHPAVIFFATLMTRESQMIFTLRFAV